MRQRADVAARCIEYAGTGAAAGDIEIAHAHETAGDAADGGKTRMRARQFLDCTIRVMNAEHLLACCRKIRTQGDRGDADALRRRFQLQDRVIG